MKNVWSFIDKRSYNKVMDSEEVIIALFDGGVKPADAVDIVYDFYRDNEKHVYVVLTDLKAFLVKHSVKKERDKLSDYLIDEVQFKIQEFFRFLVSLFSLGNRESVKFAYSLEEFISIKTLDGSKAHVNKLIRSWKSLENSFKQDNSSSLSWTKH